jgi:hypothetical protein
MKVIATSVICGCEKHRRVNQMAGTFGEQKSRDPAQNVTKNGK